MKSILLLLLILVVILLAFYYNPRLFNIYGEGFQSEVQQGWVLQEPTQVHYEDAHGSAPAGVNASPGNIQYEQNAATPPVNPAYKHGNPQNVNPEFKIQPLL